MRSRRKMLTGKKILSRLAAGLLGGLLIGCTDRLETGYQPRRLGTSSTARRGYYAQPYTPEAAAAQQSQGDDLGALRRPSAVGGYR